MKTARFPGRQSFVVMTAIMACFVLARGAETAEDLEGQEARLEYEALRSAHLCFAELLVCVWSRVRGEEEFKRKVKELEVKSAAYQTALVNWIGPTAMMHYAHVPTHFAEQQDWLSQFLLNLIDGSGGVGEAQNNVLKQCKKNHTSNRKAPCAQKRALGVTGKHAHVEQRIDAKRQCLQYQSVKVICRGGQCGCRCLSPGEQECAGPGSCYPRSGESGKEVSTLEGKRSENSVNGHCCYGFDSECCTN